LSDDDPECFQPFTTAAALSASDDMECNGRSGCRVMAVKIKIKTHHSHPPIPVRNFDWDACRR
jgi:hypothetical protein